MSDINLMNELVKPISAIGNLDEILEKATKHAKQQKKKKS